MFLSLPHPGTAGLLLFVFATFIKAADYKTIARACETENDCGELVVKNNVVEFISSGFLQGRRPLGLYVAGDQPLVGKREAAILDVRPSVRWHIIVAAGFYSGYNPVGPSLAVYFFDSNNKFWGKTNLQLRLENYGVGDLLGTGEDVFQITTGGEHAYVVNTYVWLLPEAGPIKLVLSAYGALDRTQTAAEDRPPGLWINMQTYDGYHSETKGWRLQFWRWDRKNHTLKQANAAIK